MKKTLLAFVLVAAVALAGCGNAQNLPTGPKGEMKNYPTYGALNASTKKSDKVCYEVSIGNVVWSVILFETIVMPIYFIGWSLFEPVSVKGPEGCGIDGK